MKTNLVTGGLLLAIVAVLLLSSRWSCDRATLRDMRLAAVQDDTRAIGMQTALSEIYCIGYGVQQDIDEGLKWRRRSEESRLRQPAESGDARSQYALGVYYYLAGGVTNPAEAVKWFRRAAEQGDVLAQSQLGYCYRNGQGVEQDLTEAVKWFRKSAEPRGSSEAQLILGEAFEKGDGVARNLSEAAKWYRKAAENGQLSAQQKLVTYYENGMGVPQDLSEAYMWTIIAVEGTGIESLKKDLLNTRDKLTLSMTHDQIAEGQKRAGEFVAKKQGKNEY